MIAYLQGQLFEVNKESVILLCGGVGYHVNVTATCAQNLTIGAQASFYIEESLSPYDGTSLYGFVTKEDKDLWALLKSEVPNTGAKKALDLLNKAQRSVADFHAAIVNADPKILISIFGFTKKTADKLISSLKDKMDTLPVQGERKINVLPQDGALQEVAQALGALGFSVTESRRAMEKLYEMGFSANSGTETLIKEALRILKK
jgi:Holliday junction DNA helicase RuvA